MKNNIKKITSKIKGSNFWSNLFKNSFIAVLGEGGSSFINFFVVILFIRLMGSEGYGVLVLAQTYMTIIDTVLNLQCWRGVIKFGEAAKVEGDLDELCGYIKLGTMIDVLTAVLGTVVCFLLANFIGSLLNWNSITILSAKIFSVVIVSHFSGTPTAVLRMENKFNLVSIQKIVSSLIKIISLVACIFLSSKIGILTGVIIYVITDIISNLILIVMASVVIHKKYGLRKVFSTKLPKKTKEFTKFTLWTSLSDIVDIPVNYFDVFIISKLGLDMVSIFKVFKQIISLISKLSVPIYQAIFPQFSKLTASNELEVAYNAVKKIQKFVIMVILPIFIIVGSTSFYWLKIIFDPTYANYWYVLLIYIIVHIIAISYTTIHPLFVSMGKVKEDFAYVLITNILYFIVSLLLVDKLGMLGIVTAYATQAFSIILLKKLNIEKEIKRKNKNEL